MFAFRAPPVRVLILQLSRWLHAAFSHRCYGAGDAAAYLNGAVMQPW